MKKFLLSLIFILLLVGCTDTSGTNNNNDNGGNNNNDNEQFDTISPVITLNGDSEITIEVKNTYSDLGASWTDNEDGSGDLVATGTVDTNTVGSYTLTYSKTDAAGNSSTETRTVNVVDTTKPVIALKGNNTMTIEVGTNYVDPGLTVTDNYDSSPSFTITSLPDTNKLGTYSVKYNATDENNNKATEVIRTVNVVDTTAPVITVLGDITYEIGQGMPTVANFVTAVDSFEGNVIDSLDYTFTIGDYTSVGTYTLTVTASDSSGNSASADITVDVITQTFVGLNLEELSMLAGLTSMFTVTPDEILLTDIGVNNSVITQIDALTGNGYMNDGDIINSSTFNTVTAPEYIEIVESYNGSISTMNSYLAVVLPLLANITEFEVEYTYAGFTFEMIKVNDEQYQITIDGTVTGQPISIEIVIDEMSLSNMFMYSIDFSTSVASWHYEIVRDLLGIKSIVEIKQLLGDSYGVVYANGYMLDDGDITGFMFKDELNITRRMYFELTDEEKGIYYVNDDTGTEKYISLNSDGELVFEYENYSPNIPLVGSEKVRWALDQFTGINTIELTEGFLGLTKEYTFNDTTTFDESDALKIEAKNYIIYYYDSVTESYIEETVGNWFLRMEGSFEDDFDDFFNVDLLMTPNNTYDVKTQVTSLSENKDNYSLFGTNIMTITKQQILSGLDNNTRTGFDDYESMSDIEKVIYNLQYSNNYTVYYSYTHPTAGLQERTIKVIGANKELNDGQKYMVRTDKYYVLENTSEGYVAYEKLPSDNLNYIDIDFMYLLNYIDTDTPIVDGHIDIVVTLFSETTLRLVIEDYKVTKIIPVGDALGVELEVKDINQTSFDMVQYTVISGIDKVEYLLGLEGYTKTTSGENIAFVNSSKGNMIYYETGNYVEVTNNNDVDFTYYLDTKEVHSNSQVYTVENFLLTYADEDIFDILDCLDD